MIIYKITNTINDRVYIGQTVGSLAKRWSQHTTSMKNSPLYNAFRKYGRDKFKIEAVCSALSPEYLNELEQYFIKFYDCMAPKGYNLTSGGDSAYTRSEHSREQQRRAMLGHTVSDETRAKISATLMGREGVRRGAVLSEETKAKIGAATKGRGRLTRRRPECGQPMPARRPTTPGRFSASKRARPMGAPERRPGLSASSRRPSVPSVGATASPRAASTSAS